MHWFYHTEIEAKWTGFSERYGEWNGFTGKEAKSNGYNGLEMVIKVVLVGQSKWTSLW